ncbi:MAG: hypothetical protein ACOYT4_05470 [Nanoarchaeota archaeon]
MKQYVVFLLILLCICSCSAMSVGIGNPKIILQGNKGEEFEGFITVQNKNNDSINVEVTNSNFGNPITINDPFFVLRPGENKKVSFKIKSNKNGISEENINVKFTPVGQNNGIGLTSKVVLLISEEESKPPVNDVPGPGVLPGEDDTNSDNSNNNRHSNDDDDDTIRITNYDDYYDDPAPYTTPIQNSTPIIKLEVTGNENPAATTKKNNSKIFSLIIGLVVVIWVIFIFIVLRNLLKD